MTYNFFKYSIADGEKTISFFVKQNIKGFQYKRLFSEINGSNEMLAIDIIRKSGFNVIPADFSYTGKIDNHITSFIFYKFQEKLITAKESFEKGKLSLEA